MERTESSRLALLRADYLAALKHANQSALAPEAFLSVFPPSAVGAHRGILLRLRQNLVDLIESGFDGACDGMFTQHNFADHFNALDRAALSAAALSCAGSDVSDAPSLEKIADLEPLDQLAQARSDAKRAEAERLDALVREHEAEAARARAEVVSLYAEYKAAQESVLASVEQAVSASKTLSGQ
jgi:predicted RNA-binding Zn ribbon-like protein